MSNRYVYGGLVFVQTCRSHPEQYDVLAEGGHEVGFVHYRRGRFTVGGSDYLSDLTVEAGRVLVTPALPAICQPLSINREQ